MAIFPSFNFSVEAVSTGYDVFVIMGQSNSFSGFDRDATLDAPGPHIYQLKQDNTVSQVTREPLDFLGWPATTSAIGFAVTMMRDHYIPQYVPTGREVLLVPCSEGGAGFLDGSWNPGDSLYETCVSRCNTAMAVSSNNLFKGILWSGGEQDAQTGSGMTSSEFTIAFQNMVSDFRSRVTGASCCKIVLGNIPPEWAVFNSTWQKTKVQLAQEQMPLNVTQCAYADPSTPTVMVSYGVCTVPAPNGCIHYNSSSQRTLAGRYYDAYITLP